MADGRTHPHADNPTDSDLAGLVEEKQPAMRDTYLAVHRLVLESVPNIAFSVDLKDAQIGYGARQYGYDGWGVAALAPFRGWVSLAFLRGSKLDDPHGLLEGSGALVRHVKVRSLEDLAEKTEALRALVLAAVSLGRE